MVLKAEHAEAQRAQTAMADAVDAIQRTLAALDEAVDTAKAGWQGDASAAFQTAAAEWNAQNDDLNAVLSEIEGHVGRGTVQFQAIDQEGSDDFGGLRLA
ncbi:WXG100 family type VII secretion target [Nocardia sp. NBC_01377]|uniref:WXG100 family type VII secretion target n=1 Tax=Nocardia TaxID=1817 RepID=UPI001C23010A|nr:WXG100 family type VII secretion target [Nocardia noduli]